MGMVLSARLASFVKLAGVWAKEEFFFAEGSRGKVLTGRKREERGSFLGGADYRVFSYNVLAACAF